ncbi:MAG: CheR family methyltransferase, partial [Acidiferrobacterales bacterium]|nr:CheR family methyltransferase [Acidiferrobacterales bacterium]
LATDLDTNVLATAEAGVYDIARVEGIHPLQKKKYFLRREDQVRVKDLLRPYISFRPLNLLKQWPMQGTFDVIFCRNVLIYFDQPTQQKLFERYAAVLRNGGYLIIGHSETMTPKNPRYDYVGKTIYRKIA